MISAAQLGQRTVLAVEPQFRLTLLGIRTVTGETILRQDWQDFPAEVDSRRLAFRRRQAGPAPRPERAANENTENSDTGKETAPDVYHHAGDPARERHGCWREVIAAESRPDSHPGLSIT